VASGEAGVLVIAAGAAALGVSGRTAAARGAQSINDSRSTATTVPRYGLVHADMRLANVLHDGPETYVIDFEDCGYSD
jgi:Ser/Thr protein kinase RdoA (MazF antagonist)